MKTFQSFVWLLYGCIIPSIITADRSITSSSSSSSKLRRQHQPQQQLPLSNDKDHHRQRELQMVGQVTSFVLINSDTNSPITTLTNGMVIHLPSQPTTRFNIQAVTGNGNVGSVRFGYNTNSNYRVESTTPFAFCGDTGGDYGICSVLVLGQHLISATPYSGTKQSGTIGTTVQVSFEITNTVPMSPPVVSPTTSAPVISPTTSTPIISPTTAAPIISPTTSAPNISPTTSAPNISPTTSAPSKAPTKIPSKAPSKAPISLPTNLAPVVSCKVPQFIDASWLSFDPKYPTGLSESQGTIVGNDLVIIGTFRDTFSSASNMVYARDLTSTSSVWRRMDDMPLAVTHAPTVVVGMKVYMCGGYVGAHPGPHTDFCAVYDHSIVPNTTGQWTNFTKLPMGGTAGAGMIYDSNQNALYYSGGGQRLNPNSAHPIDMNNTWKYSFNNPNAGWVGTTPIPYTANHLSSVTHTDINGNQRHYFFGGQRQEFEAKGNLADNFEFVASTETWVRRANMTWARGHTSASSRAVGCGFITAGGSFNSATNVKNRTADISYYDIYSDSWTSIGTAPASGATPILVVHSNGYVHFVNTKNSVRRRISF